jgi:hypothetical protein
MAKEDESKRSKIEVDWQLIFNQWMWHKIKLIDGQKLAIAIVICGCFGMSVESESRVSVSRAACRLPTQLNRIRAHRE